MAIELDRDRLDALLRRVIAAQGSSEETGTYDVAGRQLMDLALDAGDAGVAREGTFKAFEFGPSVVETVQFVSVVLGTIKTVTELYALVRTKLKNSRNESGLGEEVRKRWLDQLVDSGVDASRATSIVDSFTDDLVTILKS